MRVRRLLLAIWPYVLIVCGFVGCGLPFAQATYESYKAQETMSKVETTYEAMSEETRRAVFDEARAYNDDLLAKRPLVDRLPYAQQLSHESADMIARLSIPKLALELPIYHGTSDNTLMIGVGHLEGTALPVGTAGGRCVFAGHSGMPNARMFDDIERLVEGDRFVVWVLGEAFAYEVVDIEVVNPDDTDSILPDAGRDLCTLLTCTPYGVNTHRLLVTGERCEYIEGEEEVPDVEVYVNRRTVPLIIAIVLVSVVGVTGIVAGVRRRRAARESVAGVRRRRAARESVDG